MQKRVYFVITLFLVCCHTLFAQKVDSSFTAKSHSFNKKITYVPGILIVAGVSLNGNGEEGFKKEIAEERNEYFPKFHTSLDNYLQYSPVAIAYGLDALGYTSKTNIKDRTAILFKGEILMSGIVYGLKKLTHQLRPDNSSYNSFPSGHTAQAFAAAAFLSEEYKSRLKWIPYLAYGIASSVGFLRMANNKHYINDVLVGAGLGILSMKVSYLTHQYKWGAEHSTAAPVF